MLGAWSLELSVEAADPSPGEIQFFENKIRPILSDKCYKCHSTQAEKVRGSLLLDSKEGVLKGGETGPAIVAGDTIGFWNLILKVCSTTSTTRFY